MSHTIKRAVILMNLGSPDSTEVKDVSNYLKEFLMDGRVIDSPYLLRSLLVKGIIVPFRAPKSAHAYRSIWTKEGSPLIVLTRQLQQLVQAQMQEPVEIAMRYGNPSMKAAYDNILKRQPDTDEVVLLPLYPHYAMSSYETAVVHAEHEYKKGKYPFKITFVKPFYNEANYLEALCDRIAPYLKEEYDQILFSFHGIPERHLQKSDTTHKHCLKTADCCNIPSAAHATCYRHQCYQTAHLAAGALGIPKEKYAISFQSRLGRSEWIKPYTAARLTELPAEGVKKLLILCPAFVSDCLETLEEIAIQGKESFISSGGTSLTLIPCLNTHPLWVKTITGWMDQFRENNTQMALTR